MVRVDAHTFWKDIFDEFEDPGMTFEEFAKGVAGPDPAHAMLLGWNRAFGIGPCPKDKGEFEKMLDDPEVTAALDKQIKQNNEEIQGLLKNGPDLSDDKETV